MAQYWAYGLNDQGEPQLLGPFGDEGEANDAGAELNRVQVVYAPNRDAAIRQLQRGEQRSRRTAPPRERSEWTGALDDIEEGYEAFERETAGSTE